MLARQAFQLAVEAEGGTKVVISRRTHMKCRRLFCLSLISSILVTGPVVVLGQTWDPTVEAASVRAARASQNTAIAARDFAKVASFWTTNVEVTAGLGSAVHGREAYRQAFGLDSALVYVREPERVDVSRNSGWPLAFESGVWTGRLALGGQPLIQGRYSAQWIKRDGRWLIRSEMFVALACAAAACQWPVAR